MKIINPRRETITVGDKSLDAIEAEWRAWEPPRSVVPDVIPPGWISASQYAEIKNRSISQARKDLLLAVTRGEVETKNFRTLKSSGVPQNVAHYRLKG